jgi:hypothetical protein
MQGMAGAREVVQMREPKKVPCSTVHPGLHAELCSCGWDLKQTTDSDLGMR